MKVLIVGYGAVGSVLTKLFLKEKSIEKIYCMDMKIHEEVVDKKIIFKSMNLLEKEKFTEYLNEIKPDVVINASLPKFNTNIMQGCLDAKVNYLDTASFWDIDPDPNAKIPYKMEQLDYDKSFSENNIIGLIESGVAPGLDNIFAAEAASQLDEVDYIKIRMVEDTGSNEIFFSWNKDWLLDELGTKPMVYENGKFKLADSFSAEEEYNFPKPIGKKKTYYFAQDEVGSIPLYIKTKKLDVKIHDNNIEVSKLLVALGMVSNKDVNVDGIEIKPIRVLSKLLPDPIPGEEKKFPKSVFAIAVEAIGKKKKKKKSVKYSVIFPRQEVIGKMDIGANFISYPTALSIKLFTMQINEIKRRGVFPPEALDKDIRGKIIKELKRYCKVFLEIKQSKRK